MSREWGHGRSKNGGSFDQNVGVRGVVYVLSNPFFREGFYKIGCTTKSGSVRAAQLDASAGGAIPQGYTCVFEKRVVDCGSAERRAFEKLGEHRRGRIWEERGRTAGQEFFEVPLERAIRAIEEACAEIELEEEERRARADEELRLRQEQEEQQRRLAETGDAEEPRSSYVFSWDKPRPGPSPGAVVAVVAAAVFVVVVFSGPRKSHVAVQAPRENSRPVPVQVGPTSPRSLQGGEVASAEQGRVLLPPGVAESNRHVVQFPPGGSAMYFAGKADGAAQASSVRLYAPPTAQGRYAVLVIKMPQNDVYAQAYLEPNDLAELAMPEGRFRLVYTKGFEWLGTKLMFGPASEVKQYGNEFDVAKGSPVVRVELPMD